MTQRTVRGLVCLAVLSLLAPAASRAQEEQEEAVSSEDLEITGRVVDSEGHPLAGVEVWRSTEGGDDVVAAVSGPDGSFTAPFNGMLGACPPGWLPDESPRPEGEEPAGFEIRLRPATRISGRVVDARGVPAEGVQVEAYLAGKSHGCAILLQMGCPGGAESRMGRTDADGRFAFESLEPGWYRVSLLNHSPTVERRLGEAGKSAEEANFVLPVALVALEGRVLDAKGAPVAGARLKLRGDHPDVEIETGADGAYSFPRVLPGPQGLEVRHPDFGVTTERVEVAAPRTHFDVRVARATVVEGRILGSDGTLVSPAPSLTVDKEPVEAGADGRFRFTLAPGEHEVRAEAPDRAPAERRVTATGEPIELELELGRPGAIAGHIAGLGERQYVSLELRDPQGGSRMSSAETTPDPQGFFQMPDVAAGAWTLAATDNLGRTVESRVQVEEGRQTQALLRFPPLPAIRGRMLDPKGQPIAGASLSFERDRLRSWVTADAEGRFTARLSDGLWTLKAQPNGYAPALALVVVQGGAPVDVPDLQLARGVALSGTVAGLAPGEVPYVEATSEDGLWERSDLVKDGRFRLADLGPGTWTVRVRLDERETSTQVRVGPGDNAVRVDLALEE